MGKRKKYAIPGNVRGIPVVYTSEPGTILFPVCDDRAKFKLGRAFVVLRPTIEQLKHGKDTALSLFDSGFDSTLETYTDRNDQIRARQEAFHRAYIEQNSQYPVDDVVVLLQVFDKIDYFFWSLVHQCCCYVCGDSRRPNRDCSKIYHTPFYRDALPLTYHSKEITEVYGGHDVMTIWFRPVNICDGCPVPMQPSYIPLELNPRNVSIN